MTHLPLEHSAADEPWCPEKCISVEQALAAYTLGSAHANFLEEVRGILHVIATL